MKRLSLLGLLAISTGILAGCPIFDDGPTTGCTSNCGETSPTATVPDNPLACTTQADCMDINQTCGSDNLCHTGDCTFWGCAGTQVCVPGPDQKAHCSDAQVGGAGGTAGSSGSGGAGAGGSTGGAGGGTAGSAPALKCPFGAASGGLRLATEACAPNGTDDMSMCCDADQGLKCFLDVSTGMGVCL